jgi:hypothetical protein
MASTVAHRTALKKGQRIHANANDTAMTSSKRAWSSRLRTRRAPKDQSIHNLKFPERDNLADRNKPHGEGLRSNSNSVDVSGSEIRVFVGVVDR